MRGVNCGLPAHSPDAPCAGGGGLQPIVHFQKPARIQFYPRQVQPHSRRVGGSPRGDENVAALDRLFTPGCFHNKADLRA